MKPTRARGSLAVAGALSIVAVAPAGRTAAPQPRPAAPAAAPARDARARGQAKERTSSTVRSARRTVTLGNRTLCKVACAPARGGAPRAAPSALRQGLDDRRARRHPRLGRLPPALNNPEAPAALTTRVAFAGDRRSRRPPAASAASTCTAARWRRGTAPGLYGGHLACGGRLSPGTLGVAHKSLPCGTRVTLRHRGRTVRVRVVDRGRTSARASST
jgi:hypothetical protein